jgi:hypothetical protein
VKLFDVATGELHIDIDDTDILLGHDCQILAATFSHDSFIFTTITAPEYGFVNSYHRIITSRADYSLSPVIHSFSTNDTHIKRIELDVYGLESFGPEEHYEAAFSRDASIMAIMPPRGSYTDHPIHYDGATWECKKIALYDVATGKLRLKKRPPGRS